ncbi:melanotransferrin isoform X2 [Anolis carolinensis]|uniref:melanotransferrin isoform X2 n=1 Tax=Anolis carolinensis TaxID=28377 RepID=UPI002F2B4C0D
MGRVSRSLAPAVALALSALLCCPTGLGLEPLRWCASSEAELSKCSAMGKALAGVELRPGLACLRAASARHCLAHIRDGLADVVSVDGALLLEAGRDFALKPVVSESYGQGPGVSYWAVAVVRRGSGLSVEGLQGSRSCHSGLNHTAGWRVPLGVLLASGRMSAPGCDLPQAASHFFGASCVPGAVGEGFPASLCTLCRGDGGGAARCQEGPQERYFGDLGAFRCLAEGTGGVAFLKHSTVPDALQGPDPPPSWAQGLQASDFELLCRDGGRAPIEDWQRCHWARVPAHAVVTRPDVDAGMVAGLLLQGQQIFGGDPSSSSPPSAFQMFTSEPFGGRDLLFKDSTVELVPIPAAQQSYQAWLGEGFLQAMSAQDCGPDGLPETLRWCVLSTEEVHKCSEMATAFKQQGLRPPVQCVSAESRRHCMEQIQKRAIDAVTLSAEDVYTAGRVYGLVPAAGESYAEEDSSGSYYAVAVVRRASAESGAFTIYELQGKRSCHTGFGRRAGWVLPVGLLLSKGLVQPRGCSAPEAVSAFFSASCVPTEDLQGYPPNLCEACAGDGNGGHKCEADSQERYYGYDGAFRCLAEGSGDVAFVKHTSVFENTDGRNSAPWASHLRSADFQLLCPNGARAEVGQFAGCHWGRVPPRAVMVHPETSAVAVYGLLDRAQDFFGVNNNSSSNSSNRFEMFSSSVYKGKDLIFKDATRAIVPVGERTTAEAWLGRSFLEAMEGWEAFPSSSPECSRAAGPTVFPPLLLLLPSLAFAQWLSI